MKHLASGSDAGQAARFLSRCSSAFGRYGIFPSPLMTLLPAGIAAIAPKPQKSSRPCAECASRFQLALFNACQMPLRLGCPAIVAGRCAGGALACLACCCCCACATDISAAMAIAPMNRFRIIYSLLYAVIFASQNNMLGLDVLGTSNVIL